MAFITLTRKVTDQRISYGYRPRALEGGGLLKQHTCKKKKKKKEKKSNFVYITILIFYKVLNVHV